MAVAVIRPDFPWQIGDRFIMAGPGPDMRRSGAVLMLLDKIGPGFVLADLEGNEVPQKLTPRVCPMYPDPADTQLVIRWLSQ